MRHSLLKMRNNERDQFKKYSPQSDKKLKRILVVFTHQFVGGLPPRQSHAYITGLCSKLRCKMRIVKRFICCVILHRLTNACFKPIYRKTRTLLQAWTRKFNIHLGQTKYCRPNQIFSFNKMAPPKFNHLAIFKYPK